MCNRATLRRSVATLLWLSPLFAQTPGILQTPSIFQTNSDWRHIGNSAIDQSLAGLATGPVERVWYSLDGSRLMIRTGSGRVLETSDFEKWSASAASDPAEPVTRPAIASRLPENAARVRALARTSRLVYAFGKFAYRSEDGGANWENLTAFRAFSILGENLRDLAVSPANDQEIVIAGAAGVFRSVDGGKSWSGLNDALPNLPAARLLSLPAGDRGVRLALSDNVSVVEWEPGQKLAWRLVDNPEFAAELQQRRDYSAQRGAEVTAFTQSGD